MVQTYCVLYQDYTIHKDGSIKPYKKTTFVNVFDNLNDAKMCMDEQANLFREFMRIHFGKNKTMTKYEHNKYSIRIEYCFKRYNTLIFISEFDNQYPELNCLWQQ